MWIKLHLLIWRIKFCEMMCPLCVDYIVGTQTSLYWNQLHSPFISLYGVVYIQNIFYMGGSVLFVRYDSTVICVMKPILHP